MDMKATTKIYSDTAVTTEMDGYVMATEPPVSAGGTGEFPPATRLVIAALLNCSFSSVKAFCQKREIPLEGLEMDFTGDFEDGTYSNMRFSLRLPQGFPEKYEGSLDKIFDTCAVKKIMKNLPEIAVETTRSGSGNGGG